jgi:hypothetical protein
VSLSAPGVTVPKRMRRCRTSKPYGSAQSSFLAQERVRFDSLRLRLARGRRLPTAQRDLAHLLLEDLAALDLARRHELLQFSW